VRSDHSAGIPILETDRLVMRGFHDTDVDALEAMAADPIIAPFVGYPGAELREACWRSIALWIGHWALRGFGMWAVEERASGSFIGRIGIWQPEGWPGTEVGWMLGPAWWGRGYATEAAHASVTWGFEQLQIDELISLIQPANAASQAVAARVGEHFRGETPFRGGSTGLWSITRAEWEAARETPR
jgi:RimJ/RimL family protein N-acetyltransferase